MNYKVIVIDKKNRKNISALGYFYMAVSDSYKYDGIKIQAVKFNKDWLEAVALRLELAGFQEVKKLSGEEEVVHSRCKECNTRYDERKEICECGGRCKEFRFTSIIKVYEPMGALLSQIQEIMAKDKAKNIIDYFEQFKRLQSMGDNIIMERWG